ncbi:MAG: hypothetical protein M3285_03795, partial [Actinomycetota bacterium]|nr:hypothetical protein [Actinomycetota bacterium]
KQSGAGESYSAEPYGLAPVNPAGPVIDVQASRVVGRPLPEKTVGWLAGRKAQQQIDSSLDTLKGLLESPPTD